MAAFLDLARFTATAGGTTDWTYSSTVSPYISPTEAGAVNTRVYKVRAESADLTQWEVSEGAYSSAGAGSFARTTVLYNSAGTGTLQSGAGTKINFSTAPQVWVVASKRDLISIEEANSFTAAQKNQARTNIAAAGAINVQVFTASGTYTPTANLLYAKIECVGGGGGGGGAASPATGGVSAAPGGGGSGAYSFTIATAATIGASQTVTIGAGGAGGAAGANTGGTGGDTSVGTLCVAKGGAGGQGAASAGQGQGGAGGAAASGTGTLKVSGGYGCSGAGGSMASGVGGAGGASFFGQGGYGQVSSGGGVTSVTSGAGGGGAFCAFGAAAAVGGGGAAGIAIITEYLSQ